MAIVFFESDRLWFRGVEPEDADAACSWINRPETRHFLDHRVFPISRAAELEFIQRVSKESSPLRSDVVFAFGPKGETAPIGLSGVHRINWIARSASWGILISPEHQGRGYGREVSRRMIDYVFIELNLERFELEVMANHEKARHVYRSVGWIEEGVRRKSSWVGGELVDTVVMSILRSEWQRDRTSP